MTEIKTQYLIKRFTAYFDGKDQVREKALKLAREISKESSAIIRKLHTKTIADKSKIVDLMAELKVITKKHHTLTTTLKKYPELYYSNMLENFIQEYAEAIIMLSLVRNDLKMTKLPDPDKLDIRYSTFLLGLSDVIGELRRCTLEALRSHDLTQAYKYLDLKEQLYEIILNLNYPEKVLPLRHKQDVARALIEKTRSELAFAVSEYSLVDNITELKKDLKKYYKKVVRKN